MIDEHIPLLERIEKCLQKVVFGDTSVLSLHVPVEDSDLDIVLRDCKEEILRLTSLQEKK